jgi:FKBP-type peptidyl-prolyl cis-trans isomerase SlyD
MVTKKGDYVAIKYVGRLEDGSIFDLNDKDTAKKEKIDAHIHDSTIVCIGKHEVVVGLDKELEGKELGKKFEVTVVAEEGFGKKDPKLFQMIPMNKFNEQKIKPVVGLQLNIDNNMRGIIKAVDGGRVTVDFNHPLAGKDLKYEVTIEKVIENLSEKIKGLLVNTLHLHSVQVTAKEGKVNIKSILPETMQKPLEAELKKRFEEIKEITFQK